MNMMTNGRPDFRRELYRLGIGISGNRRYQDNITGRNMLQGRKGALGDGKHVLSKRLLLIALSTRYALAWLTS